TDSTSKSPLLVLWIKLRDLAEMIETAGFLDAELFINSNKLLVNSKLVIAKFIYNQIIRKNVNAHKQFDLQKLFNLFEQYESSVLYLIDGYDEIASLDDKHSARQVFDYLLTLPWVVVTTRHYAALPIRYERIFRELEIIGFSEKDKLEYINKHFPGISITAAKTALIQLITNNPNIRELAAIPANMHILCLLAQQDPEILPDLADMSLTQLINGLKNFILKRYDEKWLKKTGYREWHKNLPSKNIYQIKEIIEEESRTNLIPCLALLAKKMFIAKRLLFTPVILDQCVEEIIMPSCKNRIVKIKALIQAVISSGFIAGMQFDDEGSPKGSGYFLHLTLQEFFAAQWIVYNIEKKDMIANFIQQYRYLPRYQMAWQFTSGLLDKESTSLQNTFFSYLCQSPYERIGLHSTLLMTQCLNESKRNSNDLFYYKVINNLKQWINQGIFLNTDDDKLTSVINPNNILTQISSTLSNCYHIFFQEKIDMWLEFYLAIDNDNVIIHTLYLIGEIGIATSCIEKAILSIFIRKGYALSVLLEQKIIETLSKIKTRNPEIWIATYNEMYK
ncbi:MAG: NACHT domain-containing protein, partial [Gammaproteobacteria bacterium]